MYLVVFAALFRIGCSSHTLDQRSCCPLWHVGINGSCMCDDRFNGIVTCEGLNSLYIDTGYCMTWDNTTQSVNVNHCPPSILSDVCHGHKLAKTHINTTSITGPELNRQTCNTYNRQGSQCRQCIDGYGPAIFSDGLNCANCSKHKHFWVLNLLFQLAMITFLYLLVVLLQIKGASSPLNIIITYSQLVVNAIVYGSSLRSRLLCFFNIKFVKVVLTIISVWNLDFFRLFIPPLCISTSMKSINVLLFDYIIAIYPIILTVLVSIGIEIHDRNCRIAVYLAIPVKKFFKLFHEDWNPKKTILNTCATFILLAYSKLLFVSINLLLAVHSYNSSDNALPNFTLLLYDPTIRFLHSEHIPYAVLAIFVIVILVLQPPLLLLLYPTTSFRKLLNCCGFRRWDVLHFIMDIFQGWYKDGTEGTRDYRPLSSLYLLMRVAFACGCIVTVMNNNRSISSNFRGRFITGVVHILLGTFFFIAKPYKKAWMNRTDGQIIMVIGIFLLTDLYGDRNVFIVGTVTAMVILTFICLNTVYNCLKQVTQ